MDQYLEKAKTILNHIPYITIASITAEGLPWNSPVYAVHDDNYRFFWNSSKESQHSKNIRENRSVFIVVYDSTVKEGEGAGVYMEAEAKELEAGSELRHALEVFYTAKGKPVASEEIFLGDSPRRFYQVTPKKVWTNGFDKTQTPPDFKVEVTLK